MAARPIFDDFSGPAGVIDQMIGEEYTVVKAVYDALPSLPTVLEAVTEVGGLVTLQTFITTTQTEIETSETNVDTDKTAAQTAATAAAASATAAATSATNSASSASTSGGSATSAATSAGASATSATASAASATAAANSATAAANSATAAAGSAVTAGAIATAFGDLSAAVSTAFTAAADASASAADAAASAASLDVPPKATVADLWTGSDDDKYITPSKAALAAAFHALTDASTVTWSVTSQGLNVSLAMNANGRVISAPTGLWDGAPVVFKSIQPAGGGCTPVFDTIFDFVSTPSVNTAANKIDYVFGIYDSARNKIVSTYRRAA